MIKVILGALLGAAIAAGAFFFFNKPEPTPQERLEAALEDAQNSTKEAGEAAADVISQIGNDLSGRATETAITLAESVTELSEKTKSELERMFVQWQESGIITENGVDYEKAAQAIRESNLSDSEKLQLTELLVVLQLAPKAAQATVDQLITMLNKQ
ncbi:hypothetical protein ACFE33_01205 [Falsihalocynthiibacter sp. SS001]|uniref:hypothetical protein n=1 Tax=Falsihalocynthiibacter sp. SS001 TaxID=3349698 RepID=UPI0036D2FD05